MDEHASNPLSTYITAVVYTISALHTAACCLGLAIVVPYISPDTDSERANAAGIFLAVLGALSSVAWFLSGRRLWRRLSEGRSETWRTDDLRGTLIVATSPAPVALIGFVLAIIGISVVAAGF